MKQFSSWYPLTDEGVAGHAPEGAAAFQIKRADGLIDYPGGKSAMLCYFYAGDRGADALRERFGDEIDSPGSRGFGELRFRYIEGGEEAKETLGDVLFKFVKNFGEPPCFNTYPDDD